MSDIELVISRTKALESRLKEELGAKGNGLKELTDSVKGKLSDDTVKQLYAISEARNRIAHDPAHNELEDRQAFLDQCNSVESTFNDRIPAQDLSGECLIVALLAIAAIAAVIYLFF